MLRCACTGSLSCCQPDKSEQPAADTKTFCPLTDKHYLQCLMLQSEAAMGSPSAQHGQVSWQPLTPEMGLCSLNPQFFTSQQMFFVPVISHNVFSSLLESGNTSTHLNSCLPASNVTFLSFEVMFVSSPHLPLFCMGSLPSLVACLVFGVRLRFRDGLLMPNVACARTSFLVCSKTKGSFL